MSERKFYLHPAHSYILASIPWSLAETRQREIESKFNGIPLFAISNAATLDIFDLAAVLADRPAYEIHKLKPEVAVAIVFEALIAHERALYRRRGRSFIEWGLEMFGKIVKDPVERVTRFVEEALELGHATGLTREVLMKLIDRVYSRPTGGIDQEAAQCLLTLEGFCSVVEVNLEKEAEKEWERVHSVSKAEWQRRHAAKVAQGVAGK